MRWKVRTGAFRLDRDHVYEAGQEFSATVDQVRATGLSHLLEPARRAPDRQNGDAHERVAQIAPKETAGDEPFRRGRGRPRKVPILTSNVRESPETTDLGD